MLPRIEPSLFREKAHLVTHRNCLDGCGCAIVFLSAGGQEENIHFIPAGGLPSFVKKSPVMQTDAFLIFADVGTTSLSITDALEKRGNCVLLDHHATSNHMTGREWCDIRMDRCGSVLLAEYLFVMLTYGGLSEMITVIDNYDRGLFTMREGVEMAAWMNFVGQEKFIESFACSVETRFSDPNSIWGIEEQAVLDILFEREERWIDEALSRIKVYDIDWPVKARVGYIITSCDAINRLLDTALERFPAVDIVVQINLDKNAVSIRGRAKYDLAEFARSFGGGGHPRAAGHPLPPDLADLIIEGIYE